MKKITSKKAAKPRFPAFCDFSCAFAAFAPPDSSGACRREIAVYCKKTGKYNTKNSKCLLSG
jgi:hypothetical protein